MLTFLLSVALVGLVYGQRRRLVALEGTLATLRLRIEALEGRTASAAPLPSVARAIVPVRPSEPEAKPVPPPEPIHRSELVIVPGPTASPEPLPRRIPPAPPTGSPERESLEARIGSRWLLYVGVCAMLVGVAFFEKLAMDRQWIGDAARGRRHEERVGAEQHSF